ncbi:MAG: ornithine carbamoyltransferase [Deltaproteobacteria bacterium]|jgi:ornithine carbamoyltransferase|nr:ornithine carbamoyltransferase [Deltaproteobacteria bacterium]MBW2530723.1 ornithine carbamoyltransferase [Deltaproteobacteria bacterium]
MIRHLRSLCDLDKPEMKRLIDLAIDVKANPDAYRDKLSGKSIATIYAKPSTRTRVSFEVGIYQLGAQALVLSKSGAGSMQSARGETNADTAHVLSRYVDAIVIRTHDQREIDELAEHATVPVINALSDAYHPCQALADVLTMRERFASPKDLKVVFVGPGNNVAHSLLLAGPRAGFEVVCACPQNLPPDPDIYAVAEANAKALGTKVSLEHDVLVAVQGARCVYTDTWVSMGQELEALQLHEQLRSYTVNSQVMQAAAADAVFMHCLPAHRGEEVTPNVIDGPQSIVFDQAENRLHAQKALLMLLLGAEPWVQ